jgi:acetylornithine deacetylase
MNRWTGCRLSSSKYWSRPRLNEIFRKSDDDWTLDTLKSLVKINSVNPDVGGGPGEGAIADSIEGMMRAMGIDVESQQVKRGRRNVIGVIGGGKSGESLMLNGHMDTVGVHRMKVEPFEPRIRKGMLYGRGSCDMKGGLAAMLSAARAIASSDRRLKGDLLIAAVVDEEFVSSGSEAVAERYRPSAVVVCEPTSMNVGIAHMGFVWIEVETIGKAAHGSVADLGEDAIADMAAVIGELERLEASKRNHHSLLGTPKFHMSKITGGQNWSVVPESCKLSIERRTLPREDPAAVLAEVRSAIARARDRSPKIKAEARLVFDRPPLETPQSSDIVNFLAASLSAIGQKPKFVGLPYWSDASIFSSKLGIPSVIFGPGDIRNAHSAVEFVPVKEVQTTARVLADTALRFCGSSA